MFKFQAILKLSLLFFMAAFAAITTVNGTDWRLNQDIIFTTYTSDTQTIQLIKLNAKELTTELLYRADDLPPSGELVALSWSPSSQYLAVLHIGSPNKICVINRIRDLQRCMDETPLLLSHQYQRQAEALT